ncbi:DUF4105 domain-containing protein [Parabacteroides bouchesdurhonensis]|uniref:lipoprotein N-acyltransferase Lnb domain-containing protein n=1 Tax=Parabacteroides bouchesdurhonensis TaxID=1936995 RepID=UPI000E47D674|nr:DUF4105 domain-containing protein [Parabacteroides bouchesdurhonensis]RHJ95336.1 DUF4105 domain-containing protein [Bacteroides sp. AM07-16]
MRKIKYSLLFLLICIQGYTQVQLSDSARISILTSSPYDEEVYTVYGHAAIRINDPSHNLDIIFNYGLFDFSKPNFIYRFAKGETDYKLGVIDFQSYIIEYQMRGSEVTEQVLNLTTEEKGRIWQALLENYKPENQVYRYNFFFDNCATRPAAIIEKQITGHLTYNDPPQPKTFREMINYCTRNHAWLTFGCDLALGSPTDREATPHEMMFLPEYLKNEFAKATITNPDGTVRKLISETNRLTIADEDAEFNNEGLFSPIVCGLALFLLVLLITYVEWRKKKYFLIIDCLLFSIAGIGGVILCFLSFISVHPCTWPNWSLVWLQPLDLVAVVLFSVKKLKKAAYYYHFINFAALTLMLLGWHFIPQHLNIAFIPLVATLWLRSGYGIYRGNNTLIK